VFGCTRDKADGQFRILHRKELRDLYRPSWEIKEGKARKEKKRNVKTEYKNNVGKKL
jgi:hypothetical protein